MIPASHSNAEPSDTTTCCVLAGGCATSKHSRSLSGCPCLLLRLNTSGLYLGPQPCVLPSQDSMVKACFIRGTGLLIGMSLCCRAPPTYLANAQAPWQIASGVIYPEDITDDSPYLFSEIPGRLTGSYSGYNEDPLFVLVRILPQYCVTHLMANLHCFSPFWLSCKMSYSWQELLACLALPLKKDGDPLMP